jgi:hypothetical protein
MDRNELFRLFDSLAKRPDMWVHPVSFYSIRTYLHGLAAGLKFFGVEYSWEHYHAAALARGFDPRGAIAIKRDFDAKGLTDEAMIEVYIAIEADAYRIAFEASGQ